MLPARRAGEESARPAGDHLRRCEGEDGKQRTEVAQRDHGALQEAQSAEQEAGGLARKKK